MEKSLKKVGSAKKDELTHRYVLGSISDMRMNEQISLNSPSGKCEKKRTPTWDFNPTNYPAKIVKGKKNKIPKQESEVHLVPYTFTPKSNTLSSKDMCTTSKSQDLSSYITQIKPSKPQKKSDTLYKDHLFNTYQALKFIKKLPPVDLLQLQQKKLKIPKKPGFEAQKTLVFDLDETLVHCLDNSSEIADITITINFPTGETVEAGVNIRPFAKECLEEAAKHFEVIVFTASHKCYADAVLDHLDPTKTLIHHRLYRENCLFTKNLHIKDLRILRGRKLKDVVIVDNAAYSFAYQLENGIPIISWHDDPCDRELYNLMEYLKVLAKAKDVRDVNREVFRLNTFYEDYIEEYGKDKGMCL